MDNQREVKYANCLSQMIKSKTVSVYFEKDFSRFLEFHNLLETLFPKVFSVCKKEVFGGSLLLCWKGKNENLPPKMFMNHHDVVDAFGEWEYPPFSGAIKDGKVWGRGALDTKGGLFCMLQAAEELIESGYTPECDIYFESACTEEVDGSGANEISCILKERGVRFDYVLDEGGMILDDPLGVSKGLYAMIAVGEKGCSAVKFTVKSTGGHASAPGKNSPLVKLGKFMSAVDNSKIFKAEISPTVSEMLKRFSVNMHGALKLFLGHPKFFKPLLKAVMPKFSAQSNAMLKTTIAFTVAKGSESINVLPGEAYVYGDLRTSHHQPLEECIKKLKKIADKYDVEIEITDKCVDTHISNFNGKPFKQIEDAIGKFFTGVKPIPYVSNSASDNRYMSKVSDNCFGFAPFVITDEQLGSIHGVNENVDISSLVVAVDFYKFLMGNN